MKEKIQELRKVVPIPMGEAMQLLKDNSGDIDKCVTLFKEKSLIHISELTGCEREIAEEHYNNERYDFHRTVSSIREAMYDLNYQPIDGLTKENLRTVLQWIYVIEDKDFATSLSYTALNTVVKTLALIPVLSNISRLVEKSKIAIDKIFEGYTDEMPIEEFVNRHRRLDDEMDFQDANKAIPLKVTVIKDELLRHIRNL